MKSLAVREGRKELQQSFRLVKALLGVHPSLACCLRCTWALQHEELLQEEVCLIMASLLVFP